jgi:hypothetical protein
MPVRRFFVASCVLLTTLSPITAIASFHLWTIAEIFSSEDGTVQFIELVSSGPFETSTSPAEIRTDSGKVYEFPSPNISGSTLNKRLLIATDNFESIPGAVTPNFSTSPALPANFFDPATDRIRLFHPTHGEFHSRTFTNVPTDNVFSRVFAPTQADVANSPQNFAGEVGSINRGDYNSDGIVDTADYTIWRKAFNEPVSPAGRGADGDTDGIVDDGDLALWTMRFGNQIVGALPGSGGGLSGATPEPSSFMLVVIAFALLLARRFGR